MKFLFIIILGAFSLVGAFAVLVSIRGVMKGVIYIGGASSEAFSVRKRKGVSVWSWILFKTTTAALLILFMWAGYSVFYNLLWIFGDSGFTNQEGGWTTYRNHFAAGVGGPLGLFFVYWFTRHCTSLWKKELEEKNLSMVEWLDEALK